MYFKPVALKNFLLRTTFYSGNYCFFMGIFSLWAKAINNKIAIKNVDDWAAQTHSLLEIWCYLSWSIASSCLVQSWWNKSRQTVVWCHEMISGPVDHLKGLKNHTSDALEGFTFHCVSTSSPPNTLSKRPLLQVKGLLKKLIANSGPALPHFKYIALGSHSASPSLSFLMCHMELKSSISQGCCGDLTTQFESLVRFPMCSGCLGTTASFPLSNQSQ